MSRSASLSRTKVCGLVLDGIEDDGMARRGQGPWWCCVPRTSAVRCKPSTEHQLASCMVFPAVTRVAHRTDRLTRLPQSWLSPSFVLPPRRTHRCRDRYDSTTRTAHSSRDQQHCSDSNASRARYAADQLCARQQPSRTTPTTMRRDRWNTTKEWSRRVLPRTTARRTCSRRL